MMSYVVITKYFEDDTWKYQSQLHLHSSKKGKGGTSYEGSHMERDYIALCDMEEFQLALFRTPYGENLFLDRVYASYQHLELID
ncbi:hypothetical protein ACE6H2_015978 [Prunus campanulata]